MSHQLRGGWMPAHFKLCAKVVPVAPPGQVLGPGLDQTWNLSHRWEKKNDRNEKRGQDAGRWVWCVCVCVFESLATLHSTKGGLYHSPPLQTKHTSPNKDNTVRMLPPCTQTAHGSVSEGTVPQKTSCHLHSYMHGPHFLSYLLLRKSKHWIVWHQIMRQRSPTKNSYKVTARVVSRHSDIVSIPVDRTVMFVYCMQTGGILRSDSESLAWQWWLTSWILIDHIYKDVKKKNGMSCVFPRRGRRSRALSSRLLIFFHQMSL